MKNKTKIIYLKDFDHMQKIKNRMAQLGWQKIGVHGFYSGSDWVKGNKAISFSSIGSKFVLY